MIGCAIAIAVMKRAVLNRAADSLDVLIGTSAFSTIVHYSKPLFLSAKDAFALTRIFLQMRTNEPFAQLSALADKVILPQKHHDYYAKTR